MIIYHLHNIMICIFYLTHFRELGQKYKNIFVQFLVQMKTSKFAFEINWPLPVRSSGLWFEPYILHTWGLKRFVYLISYIRVSAKTFFPGNNIVWTSKTVPVQSWIYFSTFLIGFHSVLRQQHRLKNKQKIFI